MPTNKTSLSKLMNIDKTLKPLDIMSIPELKRRARYIRNKHDPNNVIYNEMFRKQGGICAICAAPPIADNELIVDYDYVTEQLRGLICQSCSLSIGLLRDNLQIVHNMLMYLKLYSLPTSK